ncbi:MAG: hypothetical protein HY067_04830 [Betaproteobacteria bacterium]|nr:hypothetical protein [Betaproteobacteria bacterium]
MKRCTVYSRMALVFALLFCGTAGGAEWGFDANIGIDHSDNVPNAIEAGDKKSDGAATLRLSGLLHRQLSENTSLGLNLVGESATYFRFSGLDNLGIGPRAQLRHKFGLGPDAPWTAFALRALHRDYHYDYRDGWQYDAAVTAGKRIGERWQVSGSVQYDRYEADNLQPAVLPGVSSAAYDVAGWTFGVQTAFLLSEVDTLSISCSRRHGTVTAVTPSDYEVLEYSSAVARDPVFGGNLIAYRIITDTDTLSINWSHAIGRHSSVNLGYAYRRSQGEEDLGAYAANMINLSVSYSR